jgi:hypothetical protein
MPLCPPSMSLVPSDELIGNVTQVIAHNLRVRADT